MLSNKLRVSPPRIMDRQFVKPLLCGPGPCDYWPSGAEGLSRPVITPNCEAFYNALITDHHNILILEGRGPTVGKALRIGIMGVNATAEVADTVADALADTIKLVKPSSP